MLLTEPHAVPIRKGPPRPQDAIAPFVASASSYEMESEDDIGDALTLLAANGDAISMYGAGSREPILGRILSVDPELPHFVMELNDGAIMPPGKVTFVAVLGNSKMQFKLAKPDWDTVAGKPQLIPMVFPETCTILNRRASERVETPLGATFTASFVMNGTTPLELTIFDCSLGGIGLHCSKLEAKGMLKGRKLKEVVLTLGEEIDVMVELEVRFTRTFRSFLLGEQTHIGCMFVNRTPDMESKINDLLKQLNHTAPAR